MIFVQESKSNFYFWIEDCEDVNTFTIKVNTKFLFKDQKYLSP